MKQITSFLILIASFAAQAGDNGYYETCKSGSGKTVLVIGHVGGYDQPRTLEFSIEGKSVLGGKAILDNNEHVIETQQTEDITSYQEADHEGQHVVTLLRTEKGNFTVLGGTDPRTMQPLKTLPIHLYCKATYNPI